MKPSIAEQIARKVLEGSSGPYNACGDDAHAQRERIVKEAARIIEPLIAEAGRQGALGNWNAS